MAIIQSRADLSTLLTIGPSYKTMNSNPYDSRGNIVAGWPAYSACSAAKFSAAAGTGVFAWLYNMGPKVVRVARVIVGGSVGTAAVNVDTVITKRMAIGTGGTSANMTTVAKDTKNPISYCVAKQFTAAPTAGVGGYVVATLIQNLPITATGGIGQINVFDFMSMAQEPLILRTNQGIELSFGTTQTNASPVTVSFEWFEN